jgi:hypothetical protein
LGLNRASATRKRDEKINGVNCYVLTQTTAGRTWTLWIGKPDLLIRQIENDTSAAAFKAMMDKMAKEHPNIRQPETVGSIKSIETHTDIVINHKYADRDFDPALMSDK